MDTGTILHQVIDVFALLVGILGLISLFVDPKDDSKRHKFVRASLLCVIAGISIYLGVEYLILLSERHDADRDIEKKEELVLKLLCTEGEMNYEELYNETSAGFSDEVLNKAIDDLAQNKQSLTTTWPSTPVPALKNGRSLPVRLYRADQSKCNNIPKQIEAK